jgi:hypothetical protein
MSKIIQTLPQSHATGKPYHLVCSSYYYTMKALVYHGPGKKYWEEKPKPLIQHPSDAIVRITKTTICGTDLHILKGDVPEVTDGRILGHEGGWYCGGDRWFCYAV